MYSSLDYTTEKNGSPLQYPCLESPMDGEASYAPVRGVAKSWTRLSDFTEKKERNADSVFAFVAWAGVSSLEPQQAWVPSLECRGTGKDMLANVPPAPTDLDCLLPSA